MLDADQQAVVDEIADLSSTRALQVVAGAGAGKTTTLVAAIAELVRLGVPPGSILATTFTSKAGAELTSRLSKAIGPRADAITSATTHALACRALELDMSRCLDTRVSGLTGARLWNDVLGWGRVPGTSVQGLDLDLNSYDLTWRDYALAVDVLRGRGLACDASARLSKHWPDYPSFLAAWEAYELGKSANRLWDFADALELWREHLRTAAPRWRFVFVDEAQDNSEIQLDIARLLAANGRLILVGDARQAIYTWRGAAPEVFLGAPEQLGATTLYLTRNYRSREAIVTASNRIVDSSALALGPPARATRDDGAGDVVVLPDDDNDTIGTVAAWLLEEIDGGVSPGDVWILSRTNAGCADFEVMLAGLKIPYVVLGAPPFFGRQDVTVFLDYLRAAHGDRHALVTVWNRPKRYLKSDLLRDLPEGDVVRALCALGDKYPRQRKPLRELADVLTGLRRGPWPEQALKLAALLEPKTAGGEAAKNRGRVMSKLAEIAQAQSVPRDMLDLAERSLKLARKEDPAKIPPGKVVVSTIHKVKGLEAPTVLISMTGLPAERGDPDEELRLFYVALTRARNAAILVGKSEYIDLVRK